MYELHRLLGTLLSNELSSDEKLDIIGNEYDIPIEEKFRKDVGEMCNLSEGVKEAGIAIGEVRGEVKARKDIVGKMYKNGFSIEQIAQITEIDIKEVKEFVS